MAGATFMPDRLILIDVMLGVLHGFVAMLRGVLIAAQRRQGQSIAAE